MKDFYITFFKANIAINSFKHKIYHIIFHYYHSVHLLIRISKKNKHYDKN